MSAFLSSISQVSYKLKMYKSLRNASFELLCAETSLWDLKDRPAHTVCACLRVHKYTTTRQV